MRCEFYAVRWLFSLILDYYIILFASGSHAYHIYMLFILVVSEFEAWRWIQTWWYQWTERRRGNLLCAKRYRMIHSSQDPLNQIMILRDDTILLWCERGTWKCESERGRSARLLVSCARKIDWRNSLFESRVCPSQKLNINYHFIFIPTKHPQSKSNHYSSSWRQHHPKQPTMLLLLLLWWMWPRWSKNGRNRHRTCRWLQRRTNTNYKSPVIVWPKRLGRRMWHVAKSVIGSIISWVLRPLKLLRPLVQIPTVLRIARAGIPIRRSLP